jgi:hypothetical protein
MILEVSIVSSEGKKKKNYHISTLGFHYVTKNMEGLLKFCISYAIYNQIWLNLPRDESSLCLQFV